MPDEYQFVNHESDLARARRRVPRREEGGASAPPDAPLTPHGESELARKIAHYQRELDTDLASVQQTVVPGLTTRCERHGVVHRVDQECLLCADAGSAAPVEATATFHSMPPVAAADFCAEAACLVGGPRAATHGDKTVNFQNIAELWNGYWRIKCRVNDERLSTPFTAHDVGCMLELFKIARRFSGSYNADDYIDAAGYAGCAGEIAAKEAAGERTD